MKPLVSVIVPVFNGAACVLAAIGSVLAQTLQDFEIIVVDDGSTDNTRSILQPLERDGKIRYFFQENKGLSGARNTGIRASRGEFLKFLDCDDLLYPQQLERQVAHLRDKAEGIISVTDYDLEFESKFKKSMKLGLGKGSQLAKFISGNPCPPNTILVRRSLAERHGGFDEKIYSHEDTDLWLRILAQGGIFEKVEYVGCCYRIANNSLSSNSDKMFLNYCKVFEKLNQNLKERFRNLPDDVIPQLLSSNMRLIQMCFVRKISPAGCIPVTIQAANELYLMNMNWLRRFLAKCIGIQNIARLQYKKSCAKGAEYHANLLNPEWWRDEKNYVS